MKLSKKALIEIIRLVRGGADLIWFWLINRKCRAMWESLASNQCQNEEFKRKGVVIFSGDKQFSEQVRQMIPDEMLERERERMMASANPLDFVVDLAPKLSDEAKIRLLQWALEPERISHVASYLGFIPRVATIYLMYNIPKGGVKPIGSMKWHRDTMVHKGVNVFAAISEINEMSGIYSAVPMDVIPESAVIELRPEEIDPALPAWDRYRVVDHVMAKHVNSSRILHLEGPPGTTAMVASGDVYHKGGNCLEQERLMLEVSYQSDCFQGGYGGIVRYWGLEGSAALLDVLNNPINDYMLNTPPRSEIGFYVRKAFWFISRVGRKPLLA